MYSQSIGQAKDKYIEDAMQLSTGTIATLIKERTGQSETRYQVLDNVRRYFVQHCIANLQSGGHESWADAWNWFDKNGFYLQCAIEKAER